MSLSEPRQETTKRLVRKHSHSWVHLNKWVCIIHLGIFSGKPLIAFCFFTDLYSLSKRSYSNHIERLRLVLRSDPSCVCTSHK